MLDSTRTRSPRRAVETESSAASGWRLDLGMMTQRIVSVEQRLTSLEQLVSKTLAKTEELQERAAATDRSVELARMKAVEACELAAQAVGRVNGAIGHIEESLEQKLSQSSPFSAIHNIEDIVQKTHTELRAGQNLSQCEIQRLDQKLRTLETLSDKVFDASKTLTSNSLKVVQAHIKNALRLHNAEIAQRLDMVERDRVCSVQSLENVAGRLNEVTSQFAENQSTTIKLDNQIKQNESRLVHCENEVVALNRRLMSALRHLSAGGQNAFAGSQVTARTPSPTRFLSDDAKYHKDSPQVSSVRKMEGLQSPMPTAVVGGDIDAFLTELDVMTKPYHSVQAA